MGFLAFLAAVTGSGVGFWLVVLAFMTLIAIFSEEEGVKATFALVFGVLFLQFIAKWDVAAFARTHSLGILLLYAGGYLGIGVTYAVCKWTIYVKGQRRRYNRLKSEFLRNCSVTGDVVPDKFKKEWLRHLSQGRSSHWGFRHFSSTHATSIIPDVSENKAALIRWMTYWPFSFALTMLNDPVRRLFEFIYEKIGAKLQEIADRAFKGTEDDFQQVTSEPGEDGSDDDLVAASLARLRSRG
jgi:hypothetical protein